LLGNVAQTLGSRKSRHPARPSVPDSTSTSHLTSVEEIAYPTDARERWKAAARKAKSEGRKPKPKKKHVEQHFDDCGEELSGLGQDIILYEFTDDEEVEPLGDNCPYARHLCEHPWASSLLHCFTASRHMLESSPSNLCTATSIAEALLWLRKVPHECSLMMLATEAPNTLLATFRVQSNQHETFHIQTSINVSSSNELFTLSRLLDEAQPGVVLLHGTTSSHNESLATMLNPNRHPSHDDSTRVMLAIAHATAMQSSTFFLASHASSDHVPQLELPDVYASVLHSTTCLTNSPQIAELLLHATDTPSKSVNDSWLLTGAVL